MAIQRTRLFTNIVFYPLAIVSALFTLRLFWDFGSSYFSAISLAIVGLSMEFLKLVFLAKWRNQLLLKQRGKIVNAIGYISLACLCSFASLAFGVSTIDRKMAHEDVTKLSAYGTQDQIQATQTRLSQINDLGDTKADQNAIQRQIEALTRQIDNVTIGVTERSIAITTEIERLQSKKAYLANLKPTSEREEISKKLVDLKTKYAAQLSKETDVRGTFETIASVVGLGQKTVMVIFLFFVTIAMEIGIAVTSGALNGQNLSKPGKKLRPTDQLEFEHIQKENRV